MPILIDFSGTIHAAVHVDINTNRETSKEYLRHIIINQIRAINKNFSNKYGELIICMDSPCGYWRKDVFPFYKAKRKEAREASAINWGLVFSYINEISKEITENLPYRTIRVDKAEADDVIGTLVINKPWFTNTSDPFDTKNSCLIVSNDHDFKQLHSNSSLEVKQYFPFSKKTECVKNPKQYLAEHIIRGDAGDGIPNIRSPRDIFVQPVKKRQLPVTTKYIKSIKETKVVPECDKNRFIENAKLIDLNNVPNEIKRNIIDAYLSNNRPNRSKLFPYLVRNDLNYLLDRISDF